MQGKKIIVRIIHVMDATSPKEDICGIHGRSYTHVNLGHTHNQLIHVIYICLQ